MAEEAEVPEAEEPEKPEAEVKEEPKQSMVPHQALHEQRELNKQLRAQLQEHSQRSEKMEQTFQKLLSNLNTKPAPAFDEDPLGFFQAENAELKQHLSQINEKLSGFDKASQEQQQIQGLVGAITASEAEFRSTHSDYDLAVKHLKEVRRQDMRDLGLPAEQIEAALTQEIVAFGRLALQQGKNPAEAAYSQARRYGYKPKEGSKIETLAKGIEASQTVQGGRGGGLTLHDLAQLPEDQLDTLIKDDKKWAALIKGGTLQ